MFTKEQLLKTLDEVLKPYDGSLAEDGQGNEIDLCYLVKNVLIHEVLQLMQSQPPALRVVDPTATTSLNDQLGITQERSEVITAELNQMARLFNGQLIRASDIFSYICHFCRNTEELVLATILHTDWRRKQGHGDVFYNNKEGK